MITRSSLSCACLVLLGSGQAIASNTAVPTSHYTPHVSSSHASSSHAGWHGNHGNYSHGYYHGYVYYGGYPWFSPLYYGSAVTLYSDNFYAQPEAVQYVEMAPPAAVAPAATAPGPATQAVAAPSNSWYYCKNPDGYYPYVKACPGGWEVVPAQPINP